MNSELISESMVIGVLVLFRVTWLLASAWLLNAGLRGRQPWISIALWRTTMVGVFAIVLVTPYIPGWGPRLTPGLTQVSHAVMPILGFPQIEDQFDKPIRKDVKDLRTAVGSQPSKSAGPPMPVARTITPESTTGSLGQTIVQLLLGGYLIVLTLSLSQLLLQYWRLKSMIRRAKPASGEIADLVDATARSMGQQRPIEVLISNDVSGPLTAGIVRQVIVFPADWWSSLSESQRQFVIAHECAHVSGHDAFWVLAARVMQILFWPHPLCWALPDAHRFACDVRCDQIASAQDTFGYSQLLARFALSLQSKAPSPLAMAMFGQSETIKRIRLIDRGVASGIPSRGKRILGMFAILLGVCVIGTVGVNPLRPNHFFGEDQDDAMNTIRVTVVDANQNPVVGAKVQIDGLRTRKERASAHSNRKRVTVKTNDQGVAEVSYPRYAYERMEVGEISLHINHPEFIHYRKEYSVDAPVTARLDAGRRVRLTAIDAGTNTRIKSQLFGLAPSNDGAVSWTMQKDDVLLSGPVSSEIQSLMLVARQEDQSLLFSDPIDLSKQPKGDCRIDDVPMHPAVKVKGQLDTNVPRPVVAGRIGMQIAISTADKPSHGTTIFWGDFAKINRDGTFEFSAVPRNQTIEAMAVCEGWVSCSASVDDILRRLPYVKDANQAESMRDSMVVAQQFEPETLAAITVAMERTATCEFQAVDVDGAPIAAAKIIMSPNGVWTPGGSNIVAQNFFRSEELLGFSEEDLEKHWAEKMRDRWKTYPFTATTDAKGHCLIHDLPGKRGQSFQMEHAEYELQAIEPIPFHRTWHVDLTPGDTYQAELTLQRKGKQVLGK